MVRRALRSPASVPAGAILAMCAAILVGAPLAAAAVKGVFSLLVLAAATAVAHALGQSRWSRPTATGLALLFAVIALFRPAGPYVVEGPRTWRSISAGTTVSTSLYTRPDSARWAAFDRDALRPYLFFPMIGIENGQAKVKLTINGVDLGSVDAVPGLLRFPLAYAVPLSWEDLTASPWVDVDLTVENGKVQMFTSPQIDRGWFQRPQRIGDGGAWASTMNFLHMQCEFVVEVRIADAQTRVAAILY